MKEYKFSLTGRLVGFGAFGLVALMALLFALGVVVGQRVAAPARAAGEAAPAAAAPAPAEEPEAGVAP
jgi:hypothetical protein